MTIGNRIRRLRSAANISQVDLAKRVGVSKQTLYKYENDIVTNIPSDKIELLSHYLNCSPQFLMGWTNIMNSPDISADNIDFPVIGEVAAGFDKYAYEDWDGDKISIPAQYLNGKSKDDFFVLRVKGDSMYPLYIDGDKVLIYRQTFIDYSGQVAVVIYGDESGTIKKVEYIKNGIKLVPINPMYQPETITAEEIERVFILGVPKLLVRELDEKIITV
ncbi:MAG: XRE family transcriptional regulator [Clostridiales bacterium]|nr:XRE family transcriptional regulator [Clostridiales bacterium]